MVKMSDLYSTTPFHLASGYLKGECSYFSKDAAVKNCTDNGLKLPLLISQATIFALNEYLDACTGSGFDKSVWIGLEQKEDEFDFV